MNRKPRRNYPQENRNGRDKYDSMLDMGRMNSFHYAAKHLGIETKVDPNVWNTIMASVVAKASRIGIEEAKEFVLEKIKSNELPKEAEEPLIQLLSRYSKVR